MTALANVAHLAATDPEFRASLAADPEAALSAHHLALGEEERRLLDDLVATLTQPARRLADHLENWVLSCPGWK